jgi:Flp pilus assembly pilin Flp
MEILRRTWLTLLTFVAFGIARPRRDPDRGASLVEYALLVALITLVCFSAVALLSTVTSTKIHNAADSLTVAPN